MPAATSIPPAPFRNVLLSVPSVSRIAPPTWVNRACLGDSGKNRPDPADLTKIDQRRIQLFAVAQARIFIRPMLEQNVDVTMRRHETMGPEWDAAFVEPFFYPFRWGLENAGSSNSHLKLTVHSAQSRQYSFS